MDGSRFDDLTKSLSAQRSRRGVLGALAGAALASIGRGGQAEAHACRSVGNSCSFNGDCCSGSCVTEGRTRKICHCRSSADCPTPARCHKAVCGANGTCSSPVDLNASCNDGNLCTTGDACQADGACVGTPVTCTAPNECFTAGTCQSNSGNCSAATYHGDGANCSTGVCWNQGCCTPEAKATTCTGKCGSRVNNCGKSVDCGPCCVAANGACTTDGGCCSTICVNGFCQGGPVSDGGTCDDDHDCVNGHCCGGHCRNLATDPFNCGHCGTLCSVPNTAMNCSGGACVIDSCAGGYADCNHLASDGCETHIGGDVNNCGACGKVCGNVNGTPSCFDSTCQITCDAGYADCDDNPATGCETNISGDSNNCGGCGIVCPSGKVCTGGSCVAGCIIGGISYNSGDSNPGSYGCQTCQPATSTSNWTPSTGSACSINSVQSGFCCADGQCCVSSFCTCCGGVSCFNPSICCGGECAC